MVHKTIFKNEKIKVSINKETGMVFVVGIADVPLSEIQVAAKNGNLHITAQGCRLTPYSFDGEPGFIVSNR
jgi:hypothetical protein